MKFSMRDAGIPVLTEVIEPSIDAAMPTAPAAPDAAASRPEPADLAVPVLQGGPKHATDANALLELQSHLDAVLSERIRARVAEALDALAVELTEQITTDLRRELNAWIDSASARASSGTNFIKK